MYRDNARRDPTNLRPCFLIGFLLREFFTTKPIPFPIIAIAGILVDSKLMLWYTINFQHFYLIKDLSAVAKGSGEWGVRFIALPHCC